MSIRTPDRDQMTARISRRAFVAGLPLFLAACQSATTSGGARTSLLGTGFGSDIPPLTTMYGPLPGEKFPIPALNVTGVDPRFFRQRVPNTTGEQAGTIVVDPYSHFLYLTEEGGTAMRYGVGVGRAGFAWSGRAIIDRKQEWPKWHPPKEMMARDPEAAKYPNGMDGGLTNPLGARALYLQQNGRDTLYRIHGTTQPRSIGRSMSSGCIRLFNQDIIDLYNRTAIGTPVVVLTAAAPSV